MKIKKRALDLWLEALRSGEYKQGKGALQRSVDDRDTFCCMGVLCEVARKDGVVMEIGNRGGYESDTTYNGSWDFLPQAVKDWAGWRMIPGTEPFGESHLANWNDAEQMSFPRIADLLEEKAQTY